MGTTREGDSARLDASQLLSFDREHLWHPYTSVPASTPNLLVRSAEGVRLTVELDGHQHQLIDAMSSWWAAIHGYRHPRIDDAIQHQLGQIAHVMFGGLTHEPAVELGRRLIDITPERLDRIFLCDSGSVSVEVAMKMAVQYWGSLGRPEKQQFLTWRGGYHGDTFHPMSVCDPVGGMHQHWSGILPTQAFVPAPPVGYDAPYDPAYMQAVEQMVAPRRTELAAIIIEPVVQGAGRMNFHNPLYLDGLRSIADEHELLLIFDEIATGFGRTGTLFAADHANSAPDIMCVGKALTGGYMTMAATLCTAEIGEGISRGDLPVLAHGPTFMANPLACAAAIASIDLLSESRWQDNVSRISGRLGAGLQGAAGTPGVTDVRVLGAIGVIEMSEAVDVPAATAAAIAEGVWLRPFRNLIYTMPPFITENADVDRIVRAMLAAAAATAAA